MWEGGREGGKERRGEEEVGDDRDGDMVVAWARKGNGEGELVLMVRCVQIAKSLIAGKVKGIVWPFAKAGLTRWEDYKGNARVIEGDGPYGLVR